jgi:hypothetical protein
MKKETSAHVGTPGSIEAGPREPTEASLEAMETLLAVSHEEAVKMRAKSIAEEEELEQLLARVSFRNRFLRDEEDRYVRLFREYTEAAHSRRQSLASEQWSRARGGLRQQVQEEGDQWSRTRGGLRQQVQEEGDQGTNGLNSWYDNLREQKKHLKLFKDKLILQ